MCGKYTIRALETEKRTITCILGAFEPFVQKNDEKLGFNTFTRRCVKEFTILGTLTEEDKDASLLDMEIFPGNITSQT